MKFIRKVINSDRLQNILSIPDELKHKKVEVIILPVLEHETRPGKQNKFNPADFSGVMKIKNIDEKIKLIRNEWDRS